MKKIVALLVAMMMLMTAAFAIAEEQAATEPTTVEITFEGTWVPVESLGFQIYLPSDWTVFEDENAILSCGTEDQSQMMAMYATEANGAELETIATGIASELGYTVGATTINGISFMLFDAEAEGAFGAFSNTAENEYCVQFVFAPRDDAEFQNLAQQIMASVTNIEATEAAAEETEAGVEETEETDAE